MDIISSRILNIIRAWTGHMQFSHGRDCTSSSWALCYNSCCSDTSQSAGRLTERARWPRQSGSHVAFVGLGFLDTQTIVCCCEWYRGTVWKSYEVMILRISLRHGISALYVYLGSVRQHVGHCNVLPSRSISHKALSG